MDGQPVPLVRFVVVWLGTLALGPLHATAEGAATTQDTAAAAQAQEALAVGDREGALRALIEGIDAAAQSGRHAAAAPLLNSLGNLYVSAGRQLDAVAAFADGLRLASFADPALRATLALNRLRAVHMTSAVAPAGWLSEAAALVEAVGDAHTKATYLLALGSLRELAGEPAAAEQAYREARRRLEPQGASAALAYAIGYLGNLSALAGNQSRAMALTREAILIAQQSRAADALYRFEWQLARYHAHRGEHRQAAALYATALESLEAVRSSIWAASNSEFDRLFRPLYYEYADLLLASGRPDLSRVRGVIERGKLAELENYFRDECASAEWRLENLVGLDESAALVYPVVFADRLELLVGQGSELFRFTVPVGRATVAAGVQQFRLAVQFGEAETELKRSAEQVYSWIVAPIEPLLAQRRISTLVMIPDRELRGAPFAALHDGDGYLIERFALATTPGLTLTDPRSLARDAVRVSANGITEAVAGFEPLPYVAEELRSVAAAFPASVRSDGDFVRTALASSVANPQNTVVHIATHGEFASSHSGSYLLAYDGVLPMRDFESMVSRRRYGDSPIELLVLSACETGAGDDRAALGLAGIAVQAGARSAVASLWRVSDQATARLMAEFYKALEGSSATKAEALRSAQRALLADARFGHPNYWSPFLLIGNWL